MKKTVLIMAGGSGERFWPKSRKKLPKQFLCLTNSNRTMLQSTVDRVLPLVDISDILVATNRDYLPLVRQQLPDLPRENILCEPVARNTAPCIGWSAIALRQRYGDALMLVLPSDHQIMQPHLFRNVLKKAFQVAEKTDALVTLGIAPTAPETGYGYIRYGHEQVQDIPDGVFCVKSFVEKPEIEKAKQYLASGDYLWNSGMFLWKSSVVLREMERCLPETMRMLYKIENAQNGPKAEYENILQECFERMQPISIDYGVLEKAKKVYVIPCSFGWDDVGSWLAVERMNTADDSENVISGDVVSVDTTRCIIQGTKRLIAVVGMEDTVIVETEDALLVCAKENVGRLKEVIRTLREQGRDHLL